MGKITQAQWEEFLK
jgi:hypothetical protein